MNRKVSVAPMMDCTDRHERYFLRLISKNTLLYTEMIVDEAINRGDKKKLLEFNINEKPVAPENADVNTDFDTGRGELYNLLEKGNTVIVGILALAKVGEHPRAYEVAGQLIKTQSEIAQNLLDLQDKLKKLKDVKGDSPKNVTNALFVGSTTELQKMIKKNKEKK